MKGTLRKRLASCLSISFAAMLCVFLSSSELRAQTATGDEPLLGQLTDHFKKEYLSIGLLMQTAGDFQPERSFPGNNGFSIATLRLVLSGNLDKGFGYLVRTNFTASPTILDAMTYFRLSPAVTIAAGLFRSPFSKEQLTGAGAIDFVNRS